MYSPGTIDCHVVNVGKQVVNVGKQVVNVGKHVVNVGKNVRRLRPAGWKTPQFPRERSRGAFRFPPRAQSRDVSFPPASAVAGRFVFPPRAQSRDVSFSPREHSRGAFRFTDVIKLTLNKYGFVISGREVRGTVAAIK